MQNEASSKRRGNDMKWKLKSDKHAQRSWFHSSPVGFFKLDLKDFRRSQCANVDVHVGGTSLTFFKMISRLLNYVGVKKSKEKKTKQRNHMIRV